MKIGDIMAKYKENEIVAGLVTGIEQYGIFVSLDEYYSGLIHISEISDGFVKDVNNFVNIGETIKVRVLESDDDSFHVKLSIKNLNYRINRNKSKIIETGSGFEILRNSLPTWINERNDEKNNEKNA